VVEHREQLWSLLVEAAQIEHMIMCQYLYACSASRLSLTAEQADAVARWQKTVTGIAAEEMLHLALVMNVMTAIGAGPTLTRPNFPRHYSRTSLPQPQPAPDGPPRSVPDRRPNRGQFR